MPERWTINRFADETGFDRRTVKKSVDASEREPEIDGRQEYYTLRDLVEAMSQRPAQKTKEASALEIELAKKTARQTEILDVELAKLRNQVLETETVFRVWENVIVAIRRLILTSPLPEKQKDAILEQLKTIPIEAFVEQLDFDQGSPAEDAEAVHAAASP